MKVTLASKRSEQGKYSPSPCAPVTVEIKHLLSKWEFKVKPFHFEDVTVKTITSLKKITLVTSGPHGSQKNGSSLLLLLTTEFCYTVHHSLLGSDTSLHLKVQMGL